MPLSGQTNNEEERRSNFLRRPTIAPPSRPPQVGPVPTIADARQRSTYQTNPNAFRGEGMGDRMRQFATGVLDTPSRFDAAMVKEGAGFINQDIDKAIKQAGADIDEFHAGRGLTGSDIEARDVSNTRVDLESERMRRLWELSKEQANTLANDRLAASSIGMQSADFDRATGLDRELAGRYSYESGVMADRDFEEDSRYRAEFGLASDAQRFGQEMDGAEFEETANLNRAQFGEDQYRFDSGMEQDESQFARGLEETRLEREARTGISQQEIALRAQELQQTAQLEGRRLTLQEAMATAEQEIARGQLQLGRESMQSERDIALRAQALEREGMGREDARFRAELEFERQNTGADREQRERLGGRELDIRQTEAANQSRNQFLSLLLQALGSIGIDAFDDLPGLRGGESGDPRRRTANGTDRRGSRTGSGSAGRGGYSGGDGGGQEGAGDEEGREGLSERFGTDRGGGIVSSRGAGSLEDVFNSQHGYSQAGQVATVGNERFVSMPDGGWLRLQAGLGEEDYVTQNGRKIPLSEIQATARDSGGLGYGNDPVEGTPEWIRSANGGNRLLHAGTGVTVNTLSRMFGGDRKKQSRYLEALESGEEFANEPDAFGDVSHSWQPRGGWEAWQDYIDGLIDEPPAERE